MDLPIVILDCGSGKTKVGKKEENFPQLIFPTVVGYDDHDAEGRPLFHEELRKARDSVSLAHPVENGIVTNWEDMEKLWRFSFGAVQAQAEDHAVLISESPSTPRLHRELAMQIFFEGLRVPAYFPVHTTLLSLYSSGRTSGVVVECGHGNAITAPYLDGVALPHSILTLDLSGGALTEFLRSGLQEHGSSFGTAKDILSGTSLLANRILNNIKEKHVRTLPMADSRRLYPSTSGALRSSIEGTSHHSGSSFSTGYGNDRGGEVTYNLPDGNTIEVPQSLLNQCGEYMFYPHLCGNDSVGIHVSTYNSLMFLDVEARKELYGHIVLCGGTCMMQGMHQRFTDELLSFAPSSLMDVSVVARPGRGTSVWDGGQILANMSAMEKLWYSKADYDEYGALYVFIALQERVIAIATMFTIYL